MARIALRVYNNEISDLIDHGQTEEAIAHCRHILATQPKHVDTYRLLGKAYLEQQRYGDAADILQRVLSSIPEDFVAQIGMSIIREDEGNLEAAIFHMERAFEGQPSNHAIQDELRRLYGRRDGIEPHKVRLTRGALARMYAHGNLYEQAIAELFAALSEDPQRHELHVLLASMYYHSDKKVQAAETCTKILEKLPYCLDANRLLFLILHQNNREEDAKKYLRRWVELDPYAAHLQDPLLPVFHVQDNAVTLERLQWEPSGVGFQSQGQPAWASSLGVSLDDGGGGGGGAQSNIPDWLKAGEDDSSAFAAPSEAEPLPDWMDSGGGDSSGLFGDAASGEDFPTEGAAEEGDSGFPATPEFADEEESASDWMADFGGDNGSSGEASSGWMADFGGDSDSPDEASPDWMDSFGEEEPQAESQAAGGEDQPGWMDSSAEDLPAEPPAAQPFEEEGASPEPPAGEGLDWLDTDVKAEPSLTTGPGEDEEALPDFLKEAGWSPSTGEEQPTSIFDEPEAVSEEPALEGEIPNWMQDLAPAEGDAGAADALSGVQAEADPDWLQSTENQGQQEEPGWSNELGGESTPGESSQAAESGTEEDLLAALDASSGGDDDAGLDWLDDLSAEAAQEAGAFAEGAGTEEDAEPWGEPADDPLAALERDTETQTEAEDEDLLVELPELDLGDPDTPAGEPVSGTTLEEEEGLAWLESLAAKQGIAEEELVTPPDDRPDDTPDWAQQFAAETPGEEEPAPPAQAAQEEDLLAALDASSGGDDDAGLDWLDDLSAEAAQEAGAMEDAGAVEGAGTEEDAEPWDEPAGDPLAALERDTETQTEAEDEDTAAWLAGLEEQTAAPASQKISDEETDAFDFLATLSEDAPKPEPETEMEPFADHQEDDSSMIPEWIQDIAEQTPEPDAITEPPEWLPEIDEPLPGPDVTPTRLEEWMPESEISEEKPAAQPPAEAPAGQKKNAKPTPEDLIADARQATRGGKLEEAISHYGKLIKKGKLIDEVISDLEEALRKHPVDVGLWQTLGDAYMRDDRLQEALDSYSKAEGLLS